MTPNLAGLSILLIEDEFLIAIDAEDMLKEMGADAITTIGTFEEAEQCIAARSFDLAILDVNLNGHVSFPLAETLFARGTPVLFCTGYSLAKRPIGPDPNHCIAKPYSAQSLKDGAMAVLAAAKRRGAAVAGPQT
jgi:DNA-binding response OmpR family regulator